LDKILTNSTGERNAAKKFANHVGIFSKKVIPDDSKKAIPKK
jgi:hypothetical protein